MSSAHVTSLTEKHARLDAKLDNERQRPHPDAEVIASLKKQKLRLKEAIVAA